MVRTCLPLLELLAASELIGKQYHWLLSTVSYCCSPGLNAPFFLFSCLHARNKSLFVSKVSGYANRFKELLRQLERMAAAEPETKVELITAECVAKERPNEAFGFPVSYTRGFRLPFYNIMTISFDITLQTLRSVRRLKPNLIHASSP